MADKIAGGIVSGAASAAADFVDGVGEGAVNGVMDVVKGVAMLAILAGRGTRRALASPGGAQGAGKRIAAAAQATAQFARTVITDPVTTAGQMTGAASRGVGTAVRAGSNAVQAAASRYKHAAATGQRSKYVGKAVGEGLIHVGGMFIPGAAEAESVIAVADAGKVASTLSRAADTAAGKPAEK